MADRYDRLMYISDIYYCENAPAILEAQALLKDTKENNIVAQLKFRNISGNVIKAVEVYIAAKDSFGKEIEGINSFQYTDLYVGTNKTWGEKQAITMPNNNVRYIQVAIKSVVFSDGTIWAAKGNAITEKISKPLDLVTALSDKELIKQFRLEYGNAANNVYMQEKDIWHCVCGCINKLSSECCCACGEKRSKITSYSLESLQKNMQERCAKEKEELQKKLIEEKHQLEIKHTEEKKKKQRRKRSVLLGICFSIVLIIAGGMYYYQNVYLVEYKYIEACKIYERGQLKEAQEAFVNLTGYKDSDSYIKKIEQVNTFDEANALENDEKYDEAILKYEELGNYKGCEAGVKRCKEKKLYSEIQNYIKTKEFKLALKLQKEAVEKYKDETFKSEFLNKVLEMENEIYYYMGNDWYERGDIDKAMQYYIYCDGFGDSDKRIEKYNQVLKKKYKNILGGYYKIGQDGESTYGCYIVIFVSEGMLSCYSEWGYSFDKKKMIKILHERGNYENNGSKVIKNKNGTYSETSNNGKKVFMEFKITGKHDLIVYKTPLEKKYSSWKNIKGRYTFYPNVKY